MDIISAMMQYLAAAFGFETSNWSLSETSNWI
jgi:hypothetical protein